MASYAPLGIFVVCGCMSYLHQQLPAGCFYDRRKQDGLAILGRKATFAVQYKFPVNWISESRSQIHWTGRFPAKCGHSGVVKT
jgi:hypothetical protein